MIKCTIFLTFCLWASVATLLFSQAPANASCEYKHLTFYSERNEGLANGSITHTIYLVKDALRQTIDTLGKYGGIFEKEQCICTDTSVVFYVDFDKTIRSINYFYFNGQKWNANWRHHLPSNDLENVGVLIPGRKYKRYTHRMLTPEKVVSNMEILEVSENSKLNLVERYELEFTVSADKKQYVKSKETLLKK